MEAPKIYLISRNLSDEQVTAIRETLSLTPLAALIASDPRDIDAARKICERVTSLQQPIAILADFDEPLTALNTDGTKCPIAL